MLRYFRAHHAAQEQMRRAQQDEEQVRYQARTANNADRKAEHRARRKAMKAAIDEMLPFRRITGPATRLHFHAELRATSWAFGRAQRSQIRAENQVAHTLRTAARDIAHTATGPDGSALATLLDALVWGTVVAARWHEAKNYAHQAEAAR